MSSSRPGPHRERGERGETASRADRDLDEGEEMAEQMAAEMAAVFRLLGDPTRIRLLHELAVAGERNVGDLAAAVGASETSVSQALRLLRTARVVRHRRDGRTVRYRLDDEHVRTLLEVSREHIAHGPEDAG